MTACAPVIAIRVPDGHLMTLHEFTAAASTAMSARWRVPQDRVLFLVPDEGWYARWWAHVHEAAAAKQHLPGRVLADVHPLDLAHTDRTHPSALCA